MTDTINSVDVCALDALVDEEGTAFVVEGRKISIVRLGDDVYAIGDTCSHGEVSLSGGIVDADACTIECPKHGSEFDLRTGAARTLPAVRPVPSYSARVEGGRVLVDIAVTVDIAVESAEPIDAGVTGSSEVPS